MIDLINPKEIQVTSLNGTVHTYTISQLPATVGREVLTQYPISATPKIGDYKTNHALMLKLMSYVEVQPATGAPLRLSSAALIDSHVPDSETLMRIEFAMLDHNTSFFKGGKGSTILESLGEKALALITKTLTQSLQKSSPKD